MNKIKIHLFNIDICFNFKSPSYCLKNKEITKYVAYVKLCYKIFVHAYDETEKENISVTVCGTTALKNRCASYPDENAILTTH